MSSGPERKHLLIPIHVDALVVGGDGSNSEESPLKGGTVSAAPNYSRLDGTYTFGIHLRQPTVPLKPEGKPPALEAGVHLHFRLPAVAAHGDLKKDPAFPRIPNRWLVQRYYKTDRGLRTKAWLVRSDEKAETPKDKKSAVVLLVDPPAGAPFSFRPTGVAGVLWDENKTVPKYDFHLDNKSADDVRLTAVTGGDAGFSAHYPACRSILGFYDDLDGVPDHPRPELSYLVTGWYSKTEDDPWSGVVAPLAKAADEALKEVDGKKLGEAAKGKVLEEIRSQLDEWMKDRGCSVPEGSPIFPKSLALVKALPAGVLCHGTVRNICGKTEGRPFKDFETPNNYWVDLGNTSAESFAARVARERISGQKSQNTGYVNLLEDLVTALQVGLLTQRVNTAEMDAELHQQGFAAVAGGKRWVIQQAVKEPPNKAITSPPSALPALPADLQKKLDKLNERERECERRERLLRDYRWELYALWYRWTDAKKGKYFKLAGELEQNLKVLEEFVDRDVKEVGKDRDDTNSDLKSEVEKARKCRDAAKVKLGGELTQRSGEGSAILYTLSEQPAPPFYAPKDPVLLVTGPAAKALGTQGREPVRVRVTGEELRSFSYDLAQTRDHSRKADELLNELKVSDKYLEAIPPWCVTLLKETLLLDEIDAEDSQALAKRKSRKSGKYVNTHTKAETDGVLPDLFGRFSWEHNPWIPLYLYWDVSWQANDWSAELTGHWALRHSDELVTDSMATSASPHLRNTELLLRDESLPLLPKGTPFRFSGLSFVGHPLFDLQSERIDASKASLQKLINQVKESLGNRRSLMISQPLGGLHDALMMRRAGDQLSPLDYDLWNKEKKLYRHRIGRALGKDFYTDSSPATPVGAPPAKYPDFCPIRSGLLELKNLVIIDAFGQKTMIDPTGSSPSGQSPDLSQSGRFVGGLPSPKNPLAVRLHPRFCRPLRLEFTGISAEAFGAGPICGWVVFNRFDQNLVLYAASGQPVGILQKRFDESDLDPTGGTLFYWVAVPGASDDEATVDERTQSRHLQILENTKYIQNPHLKDFARFVLSLNFAAGGRFAELINTAAQATEERVPEDNPLISVLLGRPLALVRAELRLEMDGLPALDQKLSWREDPTSGAPSSLKQILADGLATGTSPTPNRFMITGGVEKVLCPVRLGDRRSANDGLVGFFKGQPPQQQDGNVYSLNDHPFYSSWGFDFGSQPYAGLRDSQDLELSCDRTLQVTLLMDPQARVHVTSGVLPRGFLELSPEQLKGAKQIREVFFQAAPVLGTPSTPHVPKPSDDYGQWSWVYRPDVTGWAEDPEMVSAAELAGPAVGWPTLTEGWLKLKTEPVLIRSLWMKAPVKKPRKGDLVTLAWSLHKVVSVELLQLHPDGTEKHLKTWSDPPGDEWPLKVDADTTFRIRARNQAGYEDYKDIEIRTEKEPL